MVLTKFLKSVLLDWTQPFDFLCQVAHWIAVDLDVAYLQAQTGDSVPDMKWALLIHPAAQVERVIYQITAGLKAVNNKSISTDFNLAAFAINDNRPLLSIK